MSDCEFLPGKHTFFTRFVKKRQKIWRKYRNIRPKLMEFWRKLRRNRMKHLCETDLKYKKKLSETKDVLTDYHEIGRDMMKFWSKRFKVEWKIWRKKSSGLRKFSTKHYERLNDLRNKKKIKQGEFGWKDENFEWTSRIRNSRLTWRNLK